MMTNIDEDSSSISNSSNTDNFETGTSTSSHEANEQPDEEEKLQLFKKETQVVFCLCLLIFLILFLALIAVSLIVYFITTHSMDDEYNSEYAAATKKVVEAFMHIAKSKIGGLVSLGAAMIAHGIDHSCKWPYVMLSCFQQHSSAVHSQSGALDVVLCPLVSEMQRAEWESFVNKTKMDWV